MKLGLYISASAVERLNKIQINNAIRNYDSLYAMATSLNLVLVSASCHQLVILFHFFFYHRVYNQYSQYKRKIYWFIFFANPFGCFLTHSTFLHWAWIDVLDYFCLATFAWEGEGQLPSFPAYFFFPFRSYLPFCIARLFLL